MEYNFLRKAMRDTRPKNPQGLACNLPKVDNYREQLAAMSANPESKAKILALSFPKLKLLAEQWDATIYGDPSKVQPVPNLKRFYVGRTPKERNAQIRRVGAEVIIMDAFRDGKLPLIKNPTKDCTWDCHFFDMCEIDEAGGDIEGFKDKAYIRQDPYADHRQGAQNSKSTVAADSEKVHRG